MIAVNPMLLGNDCATVCFKHTGEIKTRELEQRTVFHDECLHSFRGMVEKGVCVANVFNFSACSFFTSDACVQKRREHNLNLKAHDTSTLSVC